MESEVFDDTTKLGRNDPVAWHEARKNFDHRPEFPITGLGPGGRYTLYAMAPTAGSRLVFRGGKPVREATPDPMDDFELRQLRDAAIASLKYEGPDRISFIVDAFYGYTAALLRRNYTLTDDDLTFLLTDPSQAWVKSVVEHLCGGSDYLQKLAMLSPVVLERVVPPVETQQPLRPKRLRDRARVALRVLLGRGEQ